jgi:hypothetical protein
LRPTRQVILTIIVLMAAACGGPAASPTTNSEQAAAPPAPGSTTSQPVEILPTEPSNTTNVESGKGTLTTGGPAGDDVPSALLAAVVADAVRQVSAASSQLEVVRAEAVEWSDGALGCPQAGVLYTQAIVPGFWVQIQAPDKFLDYRIDGQGNFTLCADVVAPGDQSGGVAPHPTIPLPETGDAPSY